MCHLGINTVVSAYDNCDRLYWNNSSRSSSAGGGGSGGGSSGSGGCGCGELSMCGSSVENLKE